MDDFITSNNDCGDISYLPSPRRRGISNGVILNKDNPELLEINQKVRQEIGAFQGEVESKVFASTVFSSTMLSAFRREYLSNISNIQAQRIYSEMRNNEDIYWLELKEVGLPTSFSERDFSRVLEQFLQAIHTPDKYRIFFIVSSDSKKVKINLGFQSTSPNNQELDSITEFVNNFASANWPGLKFELIEKYNNPIESFTARKKCTGNKVSYKAGIRAITGLPAQRVTDVSCEIGTIDKLTNALHGKKWCYVVIAEPIGNSEIDKLIFECRDLAGRAESMKSFQYGKNITESINETFGETTQHSTGITRTENDGSALRNGLASTASFAIKTLPLALGVLSVACPALIPVAISTALTTAPAYATPLLLGGGLLASNGIAQSISQLIKKKDYSKNETESFSKSFSESISLSKGLSFSENIVNKHAEAMASLLDEQIKRYSLCESLGAWSTSTFFIGEDETTSDVGSNILKSLQSGENSFLEPIRIHNLKPQSGFYDTDLDPIAALCSFEVPRYCFSTNGVDIKHPLGGRFDSLNTIINTREISKMINFPLSNTPGVSVRRISPDTGLCPIKDESGILLGKQVFQGREISNYPYYISPDVLAKHTLVCGINGSGKTNTILGILNSLLRSSSIPFLVIEPAKQEYVEWAIQSNDKLVSKYGSIEEAKKDKTWINVYIPGRESWQGRPLEKLSLNPFDFVWLNPDNPPKTLEHIDRLKTIVNAALPMQEILPVMMEELIYMAYAVKHSPNEDSTQYPCWLPQSPMERYPHFDENIHIPNFHELARLIPVLFKKRTYAQDITLNLKAALETRINSFKRGWKKELLNKDNPRRSKSDWEQLFERPTIINLTSLTSDDDKAFFMSIILLFIYEYRQELSEISDNTDDKQKSFLRNLLVIEEAHRVLSKCDALSTSSGTARQKVSEMFSNMISEVRAYGQGIMVADQIPCRLNEDAIKNTNLKIVHKLVSFDDRRAMSVALNLWEDQERIIGELGVGEVLTRSDMDKDAYLIKVNKNK